jgi:hypothetical protein
MRKERNKKELIINDKYSIGTDPMNVILYENGVVTEKQNNQGRQPLTENIGKETFKVLGYFATTKGALHYMIEHEIKCVGFDDFKKLNDKVEELHNLIDNLNHKSLPKI